jgi:glycosyltransferase involved in cell wall biosynthesis
MSGPDDDGQAVSSLRVLVLLQGELGERVSGPEIRGWEIAKALSERHLVTVAAGAATVGLRDGLRVIPSTPRRLIQEARRHDAVIAPSLPPYLLAALHNSPTLAIADLYDPVALEIAGVATRNDLAVLRTHRRVQLKFADIILCASGPQRDQLVGELKQLGTDHDPVPQVQVLPFGIPPKPTPSRRSPLRDSLPGIEPGDKLVLWWGSIWRWLDAETAVRVFERLAYERPDVKLVFTAGRSPRPEAREYSTTESVRALAESLGLLGRTVFFLDDWIPYDERHHYLQDADVGLTLHHDTPEATHAARARYMDYLWSGLPCVLARGDELGGRFAEAGFATLVPPHDASAASAAIIALLEPAAQAGARAAGETLREAYLWPATVRPLMDALERATNGNGRRGRDARELLPAIGAYYARRLPHKAKLRIGSIRARSSRLT